jgi:hypothetical protein
LARAAGETHQVIVRIPAGNVDRRAEVHEVAAEPLSTMMVSTRG